MSDNEMNKLEIKLYGPNVETVEQAIEFAWPVTPGLLGAFLRLSMIAFADRCGPEVYEALAKELENKCKELKNK